MQVPQTPPQPSGPHSFSRQSGMHSQRWSGAEPPRTPAPAWNSQTGDYSPSDSNWTVTDPAAFPHHDEAAVGQAGYRSVPLVPLSELVHDDLSARTGSIGGVESGDNTALVAILPQAPGDRAALPCDEEAVVRGTGHDWCQDRKHI